MKKDEHIRNAIDESLSSVRFNAHDARSVLRAVREEEGLSRMPVRTNKRPRFAPVLAAMTAVMVIVPISLFAMRTLRAGSSITTITPLSAQTAQPNSDPIANEDPVLVLPATPSPVRPGAVTKDDAVLAARACFEAQCDTSIFTFEEYTVQAELDYGSDPEECNFKVTMNSVYDNGCSFTVVISGRDASVLSYSTPRLATVPTHLDAESEEIQAWYDKYGEYIFTWPPEAQAEFSRRYEGALLRVPHEGEITQESILKQAPLFAGSLTPNGETLGVYPMLYDGRSFSDGRARYLIYCFSGCSIESGFPESYLLVTMLAADGTIESSELLPASSL